jgi:hypothetical protein
MNGDMGRGTECAISVVRGAVSVGVRDLHDAQDDDQKDTEEREEESPRTIGAMLSVVSTHTSPL